MAWTSPKTMLTGTTGTVADWNTYVRDNENYLNSSFPYTPTQTGYNSTTRALNGTVYQNTTTRALLVNAGFQLQYATTNDVAHLSINCDSTATPTTLVGDLEAGNLISGLTVADRRGITFLVPIDFYYSATISTLGAGAVSLRYWIEY